MNSFSESQKFRQWWLWAIVIGSVAIPFIDIVSDISKSNKPAPIALIPGITITYLLVLALFAFMELRTTIDANGVSFQFLPFHLKPKVKSWDEIQSAYVRKYSPLGEFGGWGIRITFGKGTAYNVSGNMGLQLVLKNGKKLLVGTRHPDEIREVLKHLNKGADPIS